MLKEILGALRQIRYGYIQVTVQDSRVIQIERTEKVRLGPTRVRRGPDLAGG